MGTANAAIIDEDWEEWSPEKGLFQHHMIAGSAAGVAEHVSIFPIDTIKTHMQCQRCPKNGQPIKLSAIETGRKLVMEEGPLRLFRGVSTMLSASIPAHAVYFSVFEAAKEAFGADDINPTPLASGASGVVAAIAHDSIMTPMDVVKQRLQLGYYDGVTNCIRTVLQREGIRAFYLSFPTTLFMNLPYSMIMASSNESFKKILNPSGELNVSVYFASGAAAGALAGLLTNPLDVAKTRLQTQDMMLDLEHHIEGKPSGTACPQKLQSRGVKMKVPPSCTISTPATRKAQLATSSTSSKVKNIDHTPRLHRQYRGLLDAMRQIYIQEGIGGFFRGAYPRLLVHAPSVAVSWTTYEIIKAQLESLMDE